MDETAFFNGELAAVLAVFPMAQTSFWSASIFEYVDASVGIGSLCFKTRKKQNKNETANVGNTIDRLANEVARHTLQETNQRALLWKRACDWRKCEMMMIMLSITSNPQLKLPQMKKG